ncbi:MAG TPA: tripartite tricarboxylate transporter substrate-binding protein, partial [Geminicoccaceae bacterium]|nr:tripartite tricarboxylate transporter substrate-binding protein [Geminicoccaceae bacterium]
MPRTFHPSRHGRLAGATLAALLATAPAATAQAQVEGLEIVAPAGPGGGYDQLARATQQVLQSQDLASGVQVVNVPGAGGTIGLAQFATGRKRGANAMVAGLGLVGAALTNKAPVTLDDVTPLARLTGEYEVLVTPADSEIRTLDDLVERFKADPGAVTWGGFALGSPDHIVAGLVAKEVGVDPAKLNYIVSGAGGEMLAQVMGGHITVGIGGYNEFAQQVDAGKLRVLGISAPERVPGIDAPTFKEQGVDVTLVNWRGLMAPPDPRPADKEALDEAIAKMVQSPEWKQILEERGWVDLYLPSDQ